MARHNQANNRACRAGLLLLFLATSSFTPLLCVAQNVKDLSVEIANAITKSGKKTVAVVDFTNLQGQVTEYGRFLAEEFSVELATQAKGFDVIDRTNLKTLLQEHKLAATGIIDPQTARKLGEVAGVQALVTGTIVPLGQDVHVSIKVLDSATARVISGLTADLPRSKATDEMLSKGIAAPSAGYRTENDDASPHQKAEPEPVARPFTVSIHDMISEFSFTFNICLKSAEKVECRGQVTSNSRIDVGLGFEQRDMYFVDNLGVQAKPVTTRLGTNRENVGMLLPPGIPINFSISVQSVSNNATSVSVYVVTNHGSGVLKTFPVQPE